LPGRPTSTAAGDATTGLLLALEPLVEAERNGLPRGVTAEAERAAYDALLRRQALHEVEVFRGHSRGVAALALSADRRRLATTSEGGAAWLWDTEARARLAELGRGIDVLAFSPDGRRLATGARNGEVRLWDSTNAGRGHGSCLR
jgi:WD40 repeat protein